MCLIIACPPGKTPDPDVIIDEFRSRGMSPAAEHHEPFSGSSVIGAPNSTRTRSHVSSGSSSSGATSSRPFGPARYQPDTVMAVLTDPVRSR